MARHLFPINTSTAEPFQRPPAGGGTAKVPERDRAVHGQFLLETIEGLALQIQQLPARPDADAVYVEFKGEPDSALALKSLDSPRDGRELVAVRSEFEGEQETITATLLVDPTKLPKLAAKVEDYLTKTKPKKQDEPRNKDLVDSISAIRIAALSSIYVGAAPVEDVDAIENWELWLRVGNSDEERENNIQIISHIAEQNHLQFGAKTLRFSRKQRHVSAGNVQSDK